MLNSIYDNTIRKMQSMESLWGKQPASLLIFKVKKEKKEIYEEPR